jgi:hypothetical protein
VELPYWAVALLSAFLPGIRARRAYRRYRRCQRGCCVNCGYDLRASPLRCPECGRAARYWIPLNQRLLRLGRRALSILHGAIHPISMLSACLCIVVCGMWVRSFYAADEIGASDTEKCPLVWMGYWSAHHSVAAYLDQRTWSVRTSRGSLSLSRSSVKFEDEYLNQLRRHASSTPYSLHHHYHHFGVATANPTSPDPADPSRMGGRIRIHLLGFRWVTNVVWEEARGYDPRQCGESGFPSRNGPMMAVHRRVATDFASMSYAWIVAATATIPLVRISRKRRRTRVNQRG